jgi:hypothetical protein
MTECRGWLNRKNETVREELPYDANREMWLPLFTLPDLADEFGQAAKEKADELTEEMRSGDAALTPVIVINEVVAAFEDRFRSVRESTQESGENR